MNNNIVQSFIDLNLTQMLLDNKLFEGTFNSAFFCSKKSVGGFLVIVLQNHLNQYFLCKLNLDKQTYEELSVDEINVFLEFANKIAKRIPDIPSEILSIPFITVDDVKNSVDATLYRVSSTTILVTSNKPALKASTGTIFFEKNQLSTREFCVCQINTGIGIVASIETQELNNSNLLDFCLYRDIAFEWNIGHMQFREMAIIINCSVANGLHTIIMQPYYLEMLQSLKSEYIALNNMRSPFNVLNFLIMKDDIGISGVRIEGHKPVDHLYLVATAIENLNLNSTEGFEIGTVRIGQPVTLSEDFISKLERRTDNEFTIVWTYQEASSHLDAYREASEKIENAFNVINLMLKNSTLKSVNSSAVAYWDIRNHLPLLKLSKVFYIENCTWRENITFIENESYIPEVLSLNDNQINEIQSDKIDCLFGYLDENDKEYYRIMQSIKWLNNSWSTSKKSDKIISLIMAIEFLLSGESGNSIIDDFIINNKVTNSKNTFC